jgi:hypothetical protein
MNENNWTRPEIDLDNPAELHTEADDEVPLSIDEAKVAGMVKTDIVYADSSINPNADDQNDLNHAEPDEHF